MNFARKSAIRLGVLHRLYTLIGVVLVITALLPAQIAHAASIIVTTTADTIDAAGSCVSVTLALLPGPGGQTSLREAVCAANSNPGPDTITFSVNGTFALTGAANEDNSGSGDLDIIQSLAIQGNGMTNTIIDGSGIERIFDVFPPAAITFDISNLTVQNGDTRLTSFKEGGAIYLHNNVTTSISDSAIINNFSGANGAIENRGTLTINNSLISNNQTIPTSGSVVGGGLHNAGALTINNTTISNNSVRGEGGGIATTTGAAVIVNINNSTISGNTASVTGGGLGNGGGMSTTGNQGTINLTNSTISGNHADNNGGGVYFVTPDGTGNATLNNVTITNNTADNDNNNTGAGGGFAQNTGAITLRNTIVAGNFNSLPSTSDDISGAVVASSSYNLIGNGAGSSGLTNGVNNNQVGSGASPINPQLGTLANNGGSTATHALLVSSPAINAANNATCAATDQRGVARPSGGTCDMGAYELSDTTPPDTTITGNPTNPSNSSSATFTFSGSDNLTPAGSLSFQCQIDGGGFSACASPSFYSSLSSGSHTFQVRAIDGAGNSDPTPASYTWVIDTTSPLVTNVTSSAANGTYGIGAVIDIQVTFGENVLVTGTPQLTLETGAIDAVVNYLSGSGTSTLTFRYTVAAGQNSADLDYVSTAALALNGGTIKDAAGNNATLTLPVPGAVGSLGINKNIVIDTTGPSVTINQASGQADPANVGPINFTVIFGEAVTNFATGDVTLSGTAGATTATVTGSGTTYNVAVSGMTTSGTVIVSIAANVATDAAGNNSVASTSTDNTVTFDNVAPTVAMSSAAPDPTNTSPIPVTVQFSENVSGFAEADIVVSNATVGSFVAVDGDTYTFSLTPTGQGLVTANIAAGVAQDTASNPNSAAVQFSRTFDSVGPTVTINQAGGQADPANVGPINFTVVFGEAVSDFATGDVTLSGTAGATTATVTGSGTTYNVAVSGMTGNGTVMASIAAGVTTDALGNGNPASTSDDDTVTFDIIAPSVSMSSAAPDPTNTSPILVTVQFSENVTGFAETDIVASNATVGNFVAVDGDTYTFSLTPGGPGVVTADIAAAVAQDAAGNDNTAAAQLSRLFDSDVPTVAMSSAAPDPTNTSPIPVTVQFSENVTGFAEADIVVSNATVGSFVAVDGDTYTFDLTPTGEGIVTADIADGVAQDTSGNGNSAAAQFSRTFDSVGSTVTINQASGQTDPANSAPINFEVIFSESVSGFDGFDVNLSTSSAPGPLTANVTGSGTTYNVAVSGMTGNGAVIASIVAGAATDAAGNNSAASTSTDNTVTFDNAAPTVAMSSAAPDPTNTSPIPVTVAFSEDVTGFTVGDITPGNGTVQNFVVVDGDTYTFDLVPVGQGLVTADIANGVAQDTSGNGNSAAVQFSRTFDSVGPTVTINQASGQADPTGVGPINFTVVFGEAVSNFATGDVTLSGTSGAATATVTGSGTTYNVAVSGMTTNGTVIASILAGVTTDALGNGNTAATSTDNTVTFVAPVPDLTITKSHTGNFSQGQTGAQYTLLVSNNGTASSSGMVTVVDTLPSGLTATALSGTGWSCTVGTLTCTRSDALGASSSYPNILLTVNVASNAAASVTNSATVGGGGEQNTGNNTANDPTTIDPTQPATLVVVISSTKNGTARELTYRDEDIIQYDPTSGQWSMIFDGSDVGLKDEDVDGFAFHQGMLLLSVDDDFTLPGNHTANGQSLAVDDADILAFVPTQLGLSTKGKFQSTPYLDGSANGLDTSSEDIDAISFDGAGNLLISITGAFNAGGIKGDDEDIFAFNASNGRWSLYFDGSRVGLTTSGEDVVALWADPVNQKLYLSTHDDYSVPGVSGSEDDIIVCAYSSLGETTACTFTRFLDGKAVGFKEAIDGIAIGPVTLATVVNAADATDDLISLPGDDADDPDEIGSQVTGGEETQLNQLFLPLVVN